MPVRKAPASPEPKPRLRHLNGEIFYTLEEARVVIEGWRQHYNTVRPHSSLGYRAPAPEAMQWPASHPVSASPATPTIAPQTGIH